MMRLVRVVVVCIVHLVMIVGERCVRIWRERGAGQGVWRAVLESRGDLVAELWMVGQVR